MELFGGLKNVNRDFLKESIAVMENATLLNLISQKIKEWNKYFSNTYRKKDNPRNKNQEKAADFFKSEIKERCMELERYPDYMLFLIFMRHVNQTFDINPYNEYKTVNDIKDNCEEIERIIVKSENENQKKKMIYNYFPFVNRERVEINDFDDVIKLKLNDVLASISKGLADKYRKFDSLKSDEQDDIIEQLEKLIKDLPQEQKNIIKKELNTDKITSDIIRNAVISGSLTTAFTAAVEIGGFAFYMAAVKSLASIAGMFGATLPFGFYTGASSLIAVLSNPLFFIPLLFGAGLSYYKKSNKKLAKNLVTVICVHIALMADINAEDSIDIYSLVKN